MFSKSDVEAEFVETSSDGAVFRFRAVRSGANSAADARDAGRSALNTVEAFLERVLDGVEEPISNWDGIGAFDEWPCEGPEMPFKYSGLGGDWNEMTVIIRDRYLATCFRQEFCRELPSSD